MSILEVYFAIFKIVKSFIPTNLHSGGARGSKLCRDPRIQLNVH